MGADRADQGEIFIGDSQQPARNPQSQGCGEGRYRHGHRRTAKGRGLLLPQAISVNTSLANLGSVSRAGMLDHAAESSVAQGLCEETAHPQRQRGRKPAGELSGGNQQKVVIARWLYRDCPIMLFDEPTRGIDIGAKSDIYRLFAELAAQGKGLLVVSSDLRELMQICDRIAVMSAGPHCRYLQPR